MDTSWPVPETKLADYRKMARKAGKIWKEYGALEYMETVEDDVKPGKHTSFPQAVKRKPGELVVFSWIIYKSKAQRDRINAKVMTDPRLAASSPIRRTCPSTASGCSSAASSPSSEPEW